MAEEKPKQEQKKEEKVEKKPEIKKEVKPEVKKETPEKKKEGKPTEKKTEEKKNEIKDQKKTEAKTTKKKPEKPKKVWDKADVYLKSIPISTKQSIAICRFIKNKLVNESLKSLEKANKMKIAIPMRGEIPHKKNMPRGMQSGRYAVKASKYFIKALKNLIGNAKVKNMNIEMLYISKAIANKAARAMRSTRLAYGGKKFKRTHIYLKAKEKKIKEKKKQVKEKKESKKQEVKEKVKEKKND